MRKLLELEILFDVRELNHVHIVARLINHVIIGDCGVVTKDVTKLEKFFFNSLIKIS